MFLSKLFSILEKPQALATIISGAMTLRAISWTAHLQTKFEDKWRLKDQENKDYLNYNQKLTEINQI